MRTVRLLATSLVVALYAGLSSCTKSVNKQMDLAEA